MKTLAVILSILLASPLGAGTRMDADAEDSTRTAGGLPSSVTYTITCWVRIDVDRDTFTTVWNYHQASSDFSYIQTQVDGTTMLYSNTGGGSTDDMIGPNMTVGVWYFFAAVKSGATGTFYWASATANSLSNSTNATLANPAAFTTFIVGESVFGGEWLNGSVAAFKSWDGVALTQAELEKEWHHFRPMRTQGIHEWHPLLGGGSGTGSATVDLSGNGRTLTAAAGAATTDNPPISW